MTFTCADLPSILENPDDPRWESAEAHAEACPDCRREIRFWRELSVAARDLRRKWETPELWPRIEASLMVELTRPRAVHYQGGSESFLRRWRIAASLLLAAVALVVLWHLLPHAGSSGQGSDELLSESALARVEATQAKRLDSMAQLEKVVAVELNSPDSALAASYRERLLAIDDAATELREEIEINRFNAELRTALLSVYEAKEQTLKEFAGYVQRSQNAL
jgi:hypothetical protein